MTCGTVGNIASLMTGMNLLARAGLHRTIPIRGVSVDRPAAEASALILKSLEATPSLLDLPPRSNFEIDAGFVGAGYGRMTPECRAAIELTARTEGLLLDPVYTGKTMAALIAHARSGRLTEKDTVLFLHTGGIPALFAYAEEL